MTYDEFAALVVGYLDQQGNPEVEDQVDAFIELGEDHIYRSLRSRHMMKTMPLESTAVREGEAVQYIVPADLLQIYGVWGDNAEEYRFTSVETLQNPPKDCELGTLYSIMGNNLLFSAEPGKKATLTYYRRPAPLKQYQFIDNPDEWRTNLPQDSWEAGSGNAWDAAKNIDPGISDNPLFDNHTDLFLYAALVAAAPFVRDEARGQVWTQKRDQILALINRNEWESQQPQGQPLAIRMR